jgi:hypothetical protein
MLPTSLWLLVNEPLHFAEQKNKINLPRVSRGFLRKSFAFRVHPKNTGPCLDVRRLEDNEPGASKNRRKAMSNVLKALPLLALAILPLSGTTAHARSGEIHDWNWYGFYHPEWQDYLGTFRSPGVGGPPTYGPGHFGPRYRYYYGPRYHYYPHHHGYRHHYRPHYDHRHWGRRHWRRW